MRTEPAATAAASPGEHETRRARTGTGDGSGTQEAHEPPSFERLLAALASGLVDPELARADSEASAALLQQLRLLGADRAGLFQFVAEADDSGLARVWDLCPAKTAEPIGRNFPWTLAQLRRGETVLFADADELPAEADLDRRTWQTVGVTAALVVPARAAGRIEGALSLACVGRHAWPAATVESALAMAGVLGAALAHRRVQEALDASMRFERVISATMAALLTSSAGEERQRVVCDAVRDLGLELGAEGATLWERDGREPSFRATHRWLGSDLWQPPERVDAGLLPWVTGRLFGGDSVRFRSLAELPPEAQAEAPVLQAVGVRSMAVVPIVANQRTVRALCFATATVERDFSTALLARIRLLGEVISAVLDRDEAERRERAAEAQAAHAARVGAMGGLVASLAHELTQPLTASLANAETALRLLAQPRVDLGELRATLGDIVADEQRARELVLKLRRYLKRGEAERRPFDLREAIAEALELSGKRARWAGVELRSRTVASPLWLLGDRVQIQQVVLNLVANAIDAATTSARREVVVETEREGDGACIVVRDSGAGMDAATLAKIFQPFFTTKRDGMGLGLSICRSLVEAHGGSIAVESAPGEGSSFRVLLPIADGIAERAS